MMTYTHRRRWSDNDRYFGPFTYAKDVRYWPFAVVLSSGDDECPGSRLRFSGIGHTLIIALPPIIKPWKRWVSTAQYEWSTSPEGGYWDMHEREYGFSYSEGFLQVFLGPQTHDSETTKSWSKLLPWTQWRHVRTTLFDKNGAAFWDDYPPQRYTPAIWEQKQQKRGACPTRKFAFLDFDGEPLIATTRIEESEHRFGQGWFKWLSWFRRAKVSRSLDITFSGETGKQKGSWKGGTIGHSINMFSGELHEPAFRRYCAEHHMTFTGEVP